MAWASILKNWIKDNLHELEITYINKGTNESEPSTRPQTIWRHNQIQIQFSIR